MPATTEVSIPNLHKLQSALANYPRTAEPFFQRAIAAAAAELHKAATKGTVPWRTGNLVQSFGHGITIGRLFAKVGPTANYAIFVHEGTKPHEIRPKKAKALFWKGAAHPVSKVNHPGSKPNPFMPRIAEKAKPAMDRHFNNALEATAQAIAKNSS